MTFQIWPTNSTFCAVVSFLFFILLFTAFFLGFVSGEALLFSTVVAALLVAVTPALYDGDNRPLPVWRNEDLPQHLVV